MNRILGFACVAFVLMSSFIEWQDEEICSKFYGNYELRNVFVYNPMNADSSFCISRAPEVNGETSNKVSPGTTFEIRLDELNLKLGDPLIISIYHKPGCYPKLVNPEVIDPKN